MTARPSRRLMIVGAGGHARVVASIARLDSSVHLVGCADFVSSSVGEAIGRTHVVSCFDDRDKWRHGLGVDAVVLAVGDNSRRKALFESLLSEGFSFASLMHPTAFIEQDVSLGEGIVVCAGAIVCSLASIGSNAIINSGSIVDHECSIGSHAHVAPGARVAGRVTVGDGAFIGAGAVVRDKIRIGAGAVIGAGGVVLADIPPDAVAYGVPARLRVKS